MPSKKVDIQDLIRYVTAAQGRLPLAVERINRDYDTDYKKEDMLGAIAGNTGDLADQLRTMLIMQMFDTQMQIQLAVGEQLPELTAAETVRFYTSNAAALSQLMSRPVNTQEEEPVNFIDAKRNLVTRLNGYKERKINQNIKEQQQATGTDGDN
jgi:hypothetical protein